MADRYVFSPGDRVRGSWDPATVVEVRGEGRNADVLVDWDPVDATGNYIGPRRSIRKAWTLTLTDASVPGDKT